MLNRTALLAAAAASAAAVIDPGTYCGAAHAIPPLSADAGPAELVQANVFIRHGDRVRCSGSAQCWTGDDASYECTMTHMQAPYGAHAAEDGRMPPRFFQKQYIKGRNILSGNCMMGELTEKGYEQQLANGRSLHAAYVSTGFLAQSAGEAPEEFFLRSDDEPRTIASGQALFTGMYPPAEHEPAAALDWWTMDQSLDDIFPNSNVCPALAGAQAAALASAEYKELMATLVTPAAEQIAAQLGESVTDVMKNPPLDCFMTHLCHDYTIPLNVTQAAFDASIEASTQLEALTMSYGDTPKFGAGPLVGELYENMRAAIDDTTSVKFALFSGHDTGPIMPLLIAFDVFDNVWPPYASLIAVELYETPASASGHSVRMVYNGAEMVLPACGTALCDWDTFADVANALIPSSSECQGSGSGRGVAPAKEMRLSF